jgi:hypothetical protein
MSKQDTVDRLRYDPEVGPGYFVQIRSDFLRWPHFSPTEKILYLVLLTYAGQNNEAWPGQERLAEDCGVSERTIRDVIKQLETDELLTVERPGKGQSNTYWVRKLPILERRQNLPPVKKVPAKSAATGGNPRRQVEETAAAEIHTTEIQDNEIGNTLPKPIEDMPLDEREAVINRYRSLLPKRR